MKTTVATFGLLTVLLCATLTVHAASKCYLCIDDQCKTNPSVVNCGSSDHVCVSHTYKLSFTGQVLTSKYCASLSNINSECRDKDSLNTVPNFGCFYCHKDLCN